MAMALLTLSSLSQPVRALGRWLHRGLSSGATRTGQPSAAPGSHGRRDQPTGASVEALRAGAVRPAGLRHGALSRSLGGALAANAAHFIAPARARAPAQPAPAGRTVRVLHRADATGPCRLVISGRMADVCAELERLAAREAVQP